MPGLAVPKRQRTSVQRSSSVAEVLEKQQARRVAVVATRVSAAESGELTVKSLQALLDTLMQKYHPSLPRMVVTQKPFAVMRRRIKESQLAVREFLEFALREWTTLATQNRMALLRNPDKAKKGSPLPEAPSFSNLAYRMPYFVAAFANNKSRSTSQIQADEKDAEIARLRSRVAAVEEERRVAVSLVRRRNRPLPAITNRQDEEDDGWTPPPWEQ